jgi:hypothetical protein
MTIAIKKKLFVHYLATWGCISTGLVYTAIGVIALLSFLKIKDGGADEDSLLVFLGQFWIGKLFNWVIMLGMIGHIIWRIYETIKDPYGYGGDAKGMARRGLIALSSLADAWIVYSVIQVLLGHAGLVETGQPVAQRALAEAILEVRGGYWLLLAVGILIIITALVQIGYVVTRAYMERLDIDYLAAWQKKAVHLLAWAGHLARGIIVGIIGYFYIRSALSRNAQYVVNTDRAFDFIGDHIGHFCFIVVAAGTICYGLFMFIFSFYYDTDKD